ncbi:MAG: hypothetical protein ABR499_21705 [Gemmatimonadaceae bacterium]
MFVVCGALYTLAVLVATSYHHARGYELARRLGLALLVFVPGPLYGRPHPAWRANTPDVGASRSVGAATGFAVALGLAAAVGSGIARRGVAELTLPGALQLGAFTSAIAGFGAWCSTHLFRQHAVRRNLPPESFMTLSEFLARPSVERAPRKGAAGSESAWLTLHDFHLRGRRVQILDARHAGKDGEGIIVPARPGEYVIEARVMTYGSERRISRLRMRAWDATCVLGERVGSVATDSGAVAICDVDRLAAWASANDDDFLNWREAFSHDRVGDAGEYACEPAGTVVAYAASGFGDDTYPVFYSVSGGRPVGVEVEFIAAGTRYPL